MDRRLRILITHPGRQHSHQAALALEGAGWLAGYWSGVPATESEMAKLPAGVRSSLRYAPVALPDACVRTVAWTPALRRAGDRLLPRAAASWTDFAACRGFDRWCARRIPWREIDAVVACEISARATFAAARRHGVKTILDAPSIERRAQDRLHGTTDSPRLHARIGKVKDAEVALADHVLTVSELARDTYVSAGTPPTRVHALPLGADLELFTPGPPPPPTTPLRLLFAGAMIRRKGFDLVLDAFAALHARGASARLRVAGPAGDATSALERLPPLPRSAVEMCGPLQQAELAALLRDSDLLLLPSRNDSYGMVVPEALASGVPVLVSNMVGAAPLVDPGSNGWVVPHSDSAALREALLACTNDLASLRGRREICRASAAAATWPAYHARLVALLGRLLDASAA